MKQGSIGNNGIVVNHTDRTDLTCSEIPVVHHARGDDCDVTLVTVITVILT